VGGGGASGYYSPWVWRQPYYPRRASGPSPSLFSTPITIVWLFGLVKHLFVGDESNKMPRTPYHFGFFNPHRHGHYFIRWSSREKQYFRVHSVAVAFKNNYCSAGVHIWARRSLPMTLKLGIPNMLLTIFFIFCFLSTPCLEYSSTPQVFHRLEIKAVRERILGRLCVNDTCLNGSRKCNQQVCRPPAKHIFPLVY
jgi:hypothetical protein